MLSPVEKTNFSDSNLLAGFNVAVYNAVRYKNRAFFDFANWLGVDIWVRLFSNCASLEEFIASIRHFDFEIKRDILNRLVDDYESLKHMKEISNTRKKPISESIIKGSLRQLKYDHPQIYTQIIKLLDA